MSCGWKPTAENGFDNDALFKYINEAFAKGMPQMTEEDEIPVEFRERDLAAFGYIGPMFIYSLLKLGSSDLVKYHAKQSAILFALHMANSTLGVVPWVGKPVKKLFTAVLVVLGFLGARNAYFGKKEPVPIAGQVISSILGGMAK